MRSICIHVCAAYGRRKWQPTPVFLPGESHGQRNMVGYSLWDHKSWTQLSNYTTSTKIHTGEGNGNPLQCSCLENSMDRGAGRLQSMGSERVGHDRVTDTHTRSIYSPFLFLKITTLIHTRGNFIHANIINMLYLDSRIMKLNTVCLVFHFYKYRFFHS